MTALSTILGTLRPWVGRALDALHVRSRPTPNRARSGDSRPDAGHRPARAARRRYIPMARASDEAGRLRVFLLGPLRVAFRERTLERWPCRKGKLLFAHLALNHSKRVSRDTLMEMFWPRSTPRSARNCLNVTLHGIRHHLQSVEDEHPIILYEDESYFINPDVGIWLDVDEFKGAWTEGQTRESESRDEEALDFYARAVRLYTGDLLEDSPYEDWLDLEREHLKEVYLAILDRISRHYSLDGDPHAAISLCERMLEKDDCQEEVHRRLMLCHFRLGSRDKALKQYRRCVRALRRELDVEPTRETVQLYERIRTSDPDDKPI